MLQQIFGDVPTPVDGADHMGFRYADVVEEGLAERRAPGDQQNGPGRDTLRGHVEQDKTDAVMLLGGRIGPHQTENPVREIRIRGPDFLTVDDEVVAVAFSAVCSDARSD